MPKATALVSTLLIAQSALAANVTTPNARRATLADYVASRDDLTPADRKAWDDALRAELGALAQKDGNDEGVTAAKSVVAGALFQGLDPARGAKAAAAAATDVAHLVPAPVAVAYELLAAVGKAPTASARDLAFGFAEHFDPDLAPDVLRSWEELVDRGRIPPAERGAVDKALAAIRARMRPVLRDILWRGVELEGRRGYATGELTRELDQGILAIAQTIQRDYPDIARDHLVLDPTVSFYTRYGIVCRELGERARPRPVFAPPPKTEPAPKPGTLAAAPLTRDALLSPPAGWPQTLLAAADTWLGVPYAWGGTDRKGVGAPDLLRDLYREAAAVDLPRARFDQGQLGAPVDPKALKPGDLVFFDTLDRGRVTDAALYLGPGQLLQVAPATGVAKADLSRPAVQRALVTARRLLKD